MKIMAANSRLLPSSDLSRRGRGAERGGFFCDRKKVGEGKERVGRGGKRRDKFN